MANFFKRLFGRGNKEGSVISEIADVVDRFVDTKEEKRKFFAYMYQKRIEEKNNARSLYGRDSVMQKVYALIFLVGYLAMTGWLIVALREGWMSDLSQFETGMVGTIYGFVTAKLSTILDFFFGSSEDGITKNQSNFKQKDNG